MRVISRDLYPEAARFLSGIDADWARLIELVGPCAHEPKPAREPYEALVRAVAYQQLHAKAGDALIRRLKALYPDTRFPSPAQLLSASVDELRACGFSSAKGATIHGIARGAQSGVVPSRNVATTMTDEALIATLVSLKGIGRWTVEMLLIYTMERADVLPADDFGLREGYRRFKSLEAAPTAKALAKLGEAWRPFRTVASWYLWRVPR